MTSSKALPFRREERLAQGPRGDVWRVRVPDGTLMVAKQAIGPTRGERSQLRDLVRRGRTLQLPLVPFVELIEAGDDVWVLRGFDPGVPLSKLALNSPLSHRQAAGTAAACLQALSQLHGAGLSHGRLHGGNVFIEPDGAIRIVDAGIGGPPSRRDRQARWADDMKATAALVYTVWPDWEYEAGHLIYDLLEAGRMGDAAAAHQGLELLAASLPPAENRPSADLALAALGVRLLDGGPAQTPPPRTAPPRVPAIATPPSPPQVATPPLARAGTASTPSTYRWVPGQARSDQGLGSAARRLLSVSGERARVITSRLPRDLPIRRSTQVGAAGAAAVAVVLGVVIGRAVAPVSSPGGHEGQRPAGGAHTQVSAPAPKPASATLQPAAPASAGFVSQVELLPESECATGGRCTLKSVLHLQGPHAAADLTWDVVAVDRCTGVQSVVANSSSTLDPSWNQVWAADQYSIPSAHPMLLYAVAESPYRVASAPLEINESASCTPGT